MDIEEPGEGVALEAAGAGKIGLYLSPIAGGVSKVRYTEKVQWRASRYAPCCS